MSMKHNLFMKCEEKVHNKWFIVAPWRFYMVCLMNIRCQYILFFDLINDEMVSKDRGFMEMYIYQIRLQIKWKQEING